MPKKLCVRCGSADLDDADLVGQRPQLLSRKSKKVLGMVWSMSPPLLRAEVCLDCGVTLFFVDAAAYRKSLKGRGGTKSRAR